ncbi:MAG TPA: tripartite tricarboxylate transporter substrate binding protein [Burkholderiales bacterium]|nr:tripartite tricarboxylate transporter substrate binding protein [Burkholderiales bacterium]
MRARRVLTVVALALAPLGAHAQAVPSASPGPAQGRVLHMIVPFPAGSSPDLIARILTERLAPALKHPVIVENRPGAGGNVGTAAVAHAAPDGYTVGLSIQGPLAVNKVLYKKLAYDPFQDLVPVTLVATSPNLLVVDPRLGVASVKDLVALAKKQPGKLNYGSVGNGSASHLTMEMFKEAAGIDLVHVPYPGSPQVNAAIVAGDVAAAFVVPATAMPLVQSGRLKALAVSTDHPSAALPAYPSVADSGFPGVVSVAWNAVVAPAGTPQPTVERLSRELRAIIHSDDVREKFLRLYFEPAGSTPEELGALMRSELERWRSIIEETGASAD